MMRSSLARIARTTSLCLVLVSCGDETPLTPVVSEDVLLLTQPDDLFVFFMTEYRGEVVLDEAGCFRLGLAPPNNATVVWPPGTSLWARGSQLELQDSEGRQIVAIGGQHSFLGGFVVGLDEVADLDALEREETRMRCPGTFWLFRAGTSRRISS